MKKLFNKILKILICICLVFSLHIVKPKNQVQAFAITPTVIGAIVLGTLSIGGLAHIATNEDARKAIVDASLNAFKNATDSVKQDFIDAIERRKLYGGIGLELASATWDWIQGVAVKSISNDFIINHAKKNSKNYSLTPVNTWHISNHYNLPHALVRNNTIYRSMHIDRFGAVTLYTGLNSTGISHIVNSAIDEKHFTQNESRTTAYINYPSLSQYTIADSSIYEPVDHWADQVGNSLDKVFETSREQGKLNVPIDGLMGIGDGSVGLHYDLSADRWVVSQTGEHWLGDVALDLNQIGVITDASTGAIVYNPDLDIPRVGIRDVTGTITDPITGENVGTIDTDIPIDGSFPLENTDAPPIDVPVPPPSVPGDINWDKLRYSGELFTTAFPFSLPWDISRALDATFGGLGDTTVPNFEIKLKNFNGETVISTIVIPDEIKNMLPFVRSVILIIFDVSIIYAIRKWFGGAS